MRSARAALAIAVVAGIVLAACAAKQPRRHRKPRVDPITKLERACNDGELDACMELAGLHELGVPPEDPEVVERLRRKGKPVPRSLAPDGAAARALYDRACAAGRGDACYERGRMRRDGVGGPIDLAAADADFVRACETRDLRACTAHAIALEQGLGIPADREAGRALMRDTCTAGHPRACANLGVIHYNGDGIEKNEMAGRALLERACDADDAIACLYLADIDERAAKKPYQIRRVLETREFLCSRKHGAACAAAARMYEEGRVDEERIDAEERAYRAVELYGEGCTYGDPDACQGYFLALVDGDGDLKQDVRRAAAMATKQCTAGHVPSCQSLGYFYEIGIGVTRDPARAEAIYRQACDSGVVEAAGACSNLAELVAERADAAARTEAAELARKGCDLGDARGCNAAGMYILNGMWPGDPAVAQAMLRRACDLARGPDEVADYCSAAHVRR